MTPDEFREIALGFPGTEERSHMNHPDFRVNGKIFATLAYPNSDSGMAALTPTQQQDYLRISPAFKRAPGKWGEAGATMIILSEADESDIRSALSTAWQNIRAK